MDAEVTCCVRRTVGGQLFELVEKTRSVGLWVPKKCHKPNQRRSGLFRNQVLDFAGISFRRSFRDSENLFEESPENLTFRSDSADEVLSERSQVNSVVCCNFDEPMFFEGSKLKRDGRPGYIKHSSDICCPRSLTVFGAVGRAPRHLGFHRPTALV